MDATLREITRLVEEVNPDVRSKGTSFDLISVSWVMQFWFPHAWDWCYMVWTARRRR